MYNNNIIFILCFTSVDILKNYEWFGMLLICIDFNIFLCCETLQLERDKAALKVHCSHNKLI